MNKYYKFLTLLFAITICFCSGQSIQLSSITNKTVENLKADYIITKDISYGDDKEQAMDIYLTKDTKPLKDKNFTVIFLHGGGYYLSDKSREERYIKPYLQKGINVINMNYRIKRGIPVATEDLTNALNFLTANKNKYNLDLKKIVLTGFSAGAQIASSVGLAQNNKNYPFPLKEKVNISAIINFSGPVNHLDTVEAIFVNHEVEIMKKIGESFFLPNDNFSKEEAMKYFQPISYFDKKDPPFFLWVGGLDDQVPPSTSKEFAVLLKKDEHKNKFIYYPKAGHSPNKEELKKIYIDIFKFLDNL